jgi:N-glycosylase/DNA lyase
MTWISALPPDHLAGNATDDRQPQSWNDLPTVELPLGGQPLSLDQTLNCGQAFRWRCVGGGRWEGVAGGQLWRLRLGDDALVVQTVPTLAPDLIRAYLTDYFRLELDLLAVQAELADAHPAIAEAIRQFGGLRILKQDPLEALLTFTMATATNVPRVTRNVREVCDRYGTIVASLDESTYHDFPTIDQILAAPVEELYGPCNLAYRARSIHAVARALAERGAGWAAGLAGLPYADAHRALDDLPFFGPKVSDCVCLFGCGFDEAVPVDIHVWAIAHELYGGQIPTRTLTMKTYARIGDLFRSTFGPWAGWAQQYLFAARRAVPVRERFRPETGRGTRKTRPAIGQSRVSDAFAAGSAAVSAATSGPVGRGNTVT